VNAIPRPHSAELAAADLACVIANVLDELADLHVIDHAGTGTGGGWVVVPAVSEVRGPVGRGVGSGSLPPWSSRNGG
jgi:hypothetical protein